MNDVEFEWKLQKIDNEGLSSLTGDNVRPDTVDVEMWRQGQDTFLDKTLTNTSALSQKHLPENCYSEKKKKKHEKEKKRAYYSRIMNVEHGTFIPLFFSFERC